ncbi:aminodeoxychorismate lyase [Marinicella sp. S1101]|uniref:aminodeoxychorismate lyase n=1 Tax=Marinicella marina TaxID=2996016 RepID=UPI002260BDA8|nr:aminodeoxychorismate lyase [Marinicella marina]MCX7555029.1 aminodeoxychorismate lyase [Marinicella marina]MDJ1141307.1 aminodeoxychorismate lyase [Marinicella marina]
MIISASFDTKDPSQWFNRALQYGDGVFETMRVQEGRIPLLQWHMQRLQHSLVKLKLNAFNDIEIDQALAAIKNLGQQSWVMKLVVFRASQKRTYQPLTKDHEWVLSVEPLVVDDVAEPMQLGVADNHLSHQERLAGIKHLSRLEQVMLADELNDQPGCDDLLVLDRLGNIIETTYQNIVLIKDNKLFTPDLSHCGVAGVALSWLSSAEKVRKIDIKVTELMAFDAMMVGNSVRGFRPVGLVKNITAKNDISFATEHPIQDNISRVWLNLFS